MIQTRTNQELGLMRKSGQITALALKKTLDSATSGVSLLDLDKIAEGEILRLGGKPSFKTVPGYNFTTCLTLNEEVVHGIPRKIALKKGDVLGIDLGTVYQGWHTDAAWSTVVDSEPSEFLKVGEAALWAGIDKAIAGNRVGDISFAIQSTIEPKYSVVRSLVGHGVGRELHEEPEVPGFGSVKEGPLLKENMTLAIEAIYTEGTKDVSLLADGWTVKSEDDSLGGLFEMSIIVGKDKAEVLTDWRK